MPNWCSCGLVVSGGKKEIARFKDFAKGTNRYGRFDWLQADNFIPYPEEYEKDDVASHQWEEKANALAKKNGFGIYWDYFNKVEGAREQFTKENGEKPSDGYNRGGYEWCCKNWGTKWGFCEVDEPRVDKGKLIYVFDTAWSPPLPLIAKASEMFPKLKFVHDWEEPGMCFAGIARFSKGKMDSIKEMEISYCPECSFGNCKVEGKDDDKIVICPECELRYRWDKDKEKWFHYDKGTKSWILNEQVV